MDDIFKIVFFNVPFNHILKTMSTWVSNLCRHWCKRNCLIRQFYRTLAWWLEWSGRPGFNPRSSQTKNSKKWYLIPPCLTLSIIRYGSGVKWSNPGKGVAPFLTPWCSSYRKGSLRVTLDYGRQLYFMLTLKFPSLYRAISSLNGKPLKLVDQFVEQYRINWKRCQHSHS